MEIGLANALSQNLGYDQRTEDLYRHQQMMMQQQAMKEAKQKLFQDSLEYQKGGNAFDQPIVQKHNQEITQKLGEYVTQNPDWETNFQKRAVVTQLRNSLKDNPHVLRAMATNENRAALLKYAQEAKAKGVPFDEDALNSELMKYQNYEKFGHPEGQEAAQKEGFQPYTFSRPKDFVNLQDTLQKAGNSIKDYDVIKPKGGNIGEWYTKPKAEQVDALKQAIYQQHSRQILSEAKKLGLTTPKQIDEWISNGIESGFDKAHSIGDPNAQFDRYIRSEELKLHKAKAAQEMNSNPSYTPFDYLVDPKTTAGQMPVKDIEKVFGDKTHGPLIGNDGTTVDLSDFPIQYDGRFIKNQGLPVFLGKINLPLDVAESRGIYKEPFGPDLGRSGKIAPEFVDKAHIVEGVDKDGNPMKYVAVDYQTPVNPKSKITRDMFNVNILPDKLVEPGGNPYGGQVYSATLHEWRKAGWSDSQIKEGVNSGKIQVK